MAQSVAVTAVDDDVDAGDTVTAAIRHTSDAFAVGSVRAVIADNDTAALAVDQPAALTLAEGAGTTYPVTLATRPTAAVQVYVVTDGKTVAAPAVLTFDASNWNMAQTVTLTAVDDFVDSAVDVRTSLVNHAVLSADDRYHGLNVEGLSVDVRDNDVANLLFSTERVDVTQGGDATYSVVLATRPLAPVLVSLTPSTGVVVDVACAAATEGVDACLLFTPDTWNVPQTVTLTSRTGAAGSVDHLASSADAAYDGRSARLRVNGAGTRAVFLPLVVR